MDKICNYNKDFDSGRIKQAFDLIKKEGLYQEKLYFQSFGVVFSLLPIKPDDDTIVAAIIYPFYDAGLITDEVVFQIFGQNVLTLLAGVNKLKVLNYSVNDKTTQLEALRKMFLTMAKDIRVILIKLAVKLYKIAHMKDFVPENERFAFAKEAFDVYVPVASRLGIYRMRIELEDLSFMYLNPEEYKNISEQIDKLGRSRRIAIAMIKKELEQFVKYCGYGDAEIVGRLKSVYSIYRKLREKNLTSIDDIYDIFAMRIILPSQLDETGHEKMDHLYHLLGMIHSNWRPISRKFKDYIAVPKPNGYRSLHTIVLGLVPDEATKPVEIQLRSSDMHSQAEYVVASHWIYKQNKGNISPDVLKFQVEWLKGLEKVHEDLEGDSDVMKRVEVDIFRDRIFVLTPKGEIKDLPVGSIPLDFAYAVHTDVGTHCIMAKVNGNVVPLDYELKNGDVVEIIVRRDSLPKLQWLSMVKTNFAKNKIRNWFNRLDRENNVKQGKLLLNKQLEKLGLPSLDQNYSILKNFSGRDLTVEQREDLVEEVGRGHKSAGNVIKTVYPFEEILSRKEAAGMFKTPTEFKVIPDDKDLLSRVLVGGEKGLPIKLGACCSPKERDDIVGYVTRGNKVTIHSQKCILIPGLDKERIISANWQKGRGWTGKFDYRAKLKVTTLVSRVGLIRDVSAVVALLGLDIIDIGMEIVEKKLYVLHVVLDLASPEQLEIVLNKIEKIPDVMQVVKEV
ncbi:MAG: RelA/SpoT family protein [Candidatus Gracilibacteria bacterium]